MDQNRLNSVFLFFVAEFFKQMGSTREEGFTAIRSALATLEECNEKFTKEEALIEKHLKRIYDSRIQ